MDPHRLFKWPFCEIAVLLPPFRSQTTLLSNLSSENVSVIEREGKQIYCITGLTKVVTFS